MAHGVPPQSIVEDDSGDHWITVERQKQTTQKVTMVHDDQQAGNIEEILLDEFTPWERPVDGAREAISELAFEILGPAEEGTAGASGRLSLEFMEHQFRARSLFEGAAERQGILIADEVGTGKTYSAGHILHHGLLSGSIRRALILCPARLADKWAHTLKAQFHIRCRVAENGHELRRWLEGGTEKTNGFDVMVSSYDKGSAEYEDGKLVDFLEGTFAEGGLEAIDLVIIDEVHNTIGFQRGASGEAILRRRLADVVSQLSRSRVGLTATPIWNSTDELVELAKILRPQVTELGDIEDMMDSQSRVTKAFNLLRVEPLDVHDWGDARSGLVGVVEVRDLLEDCERATDMDEEERTELANRLAEQAPFSSWITRTRSDEIKVKDGEKGLPERVVPDANLVRLDEQSGGKVWDRDNEVWNVLPSEAEIVRELEGLLNTGMHQLQLSSSPSAFHKFLPVLISDGSIPEASGDRAKRLAGALANMGIGSKEKTLIEVLKDLKQRRRGAVLFTYWHNTFNRLSGPELNLREKLDGVKVYLAHPKKPEDERMAEVARFCKHEGDSFPLLIATSMMQEGVDLHHSADCVIHYDVPRNPQRVEQRIGRVDRLGQTSDSIEVRYILLDGFAEHRYLLGMGERMRPFVENIGQMRPITPDSFQHPGVTGTLTDDMRERIADWNLEAMSGLDLRGFRDEDLPDVLDNKPDPCFAALCAERVYASLSQVMPPQTVFSDEDQRLVIHPPTPENIQPLIISDQDEKFVKEALHHAYIAARSDQGCPERSFAISVDWDRLPRKHALRMCLLRIALLSAPVVGSTVCVVHPGMEIDRVELYQITSSAGGRDVNEWLIIGYDSGRPDEMPAAVWQSLLCEAAEKGHLCESQILIEGVPNELLDKRIERLSRSETVLERHRLLAESRRCYAMAARRASGTEGAEEMRSEGDQLRKQAEGLDYRGANSNPPTLRLVVVKGSP